MNAFLNSQENALYQSSNQSFNPTPISQQITQTQEQNGLVHFMDIASNFWSKKFEEKAQELQSETLSEIFSPCPSSQVDAYDCFNTGSHLQINQENLLEISDNFINNFKWDLSHDEILLELAFELKCDWIKVSKKFPEPRISPKLLKDRYRQLHEVTLSNKARFTPEEDRKILKYFEKYGTNWRAISNMLPGRGATTIKNRFYSSLRNKVQRYSSEKTPFTSSKAIRPSFANLPSLRRGSFEDLSFNIQDQSLKVNFLPNIQQVKQSVDQFYDCDKFFAFESNSYETKTCEMTEEPNDLEYQNFIAPAQQLPSNELYNSNYYMQTNQQEITPPQVETNDWSQQVQNLNENSSIQEIIFEDDQNVTKKDPKIIVNELNNRVNVVMSLCFQIQQEIEKTMQKANNRSTLQV